MLGLRVTSQYAPLRQPAAFEHSPCAGVGFGVGAGDGKCVGSGVGEGVGEAVGSGVGEGVGEAVGDGVGGSVG